MSATAKPVEQCGTCRYVFAWHERLLCRRYPPSPKHNSGYNGVADTLAEYWCGEWKPGAELVPVVETLPA